MAENGRVTKLSVRAVRYGLSRVLKAEGPTVVLARGRLVGIVLPIAREYYRWQALEPKDGIRLRRMLRQVIRELGMD